jgi:hypothetical protein
VASTIVRTAEKSLLDRPDALARWVIIVEASDQISVEDAIRAVLDGAAIEAHGAEGTPLAAVYQLAFSLASEG